MVAILRPIEGLAYASDESGEYEVYVQPFPGPGAKWQISTEGGFGPVWSRDGRELFYANGNRMMAVEIATEQSFRAGTPQMLFEVDEGARGVGRTEFDVTPDGQRFLMIQADEQDSTVPQQINVVLNWFEELKQRVPVP